MPPCQMPPCQMPPLQLPMPVGNRPASLAVAYARQMEGASEKCAIAYALL